MGSEEQQIHCKQRRMEAHMPRRFRGGRDPGGLDCRPRAWAEEEQDDVQSLMRYC